MKAPPRDWLRVRELAAQLGVSHHTVRKWINSGELCHLRLSPQNIRIPRRAIEEFLARRRLGPPPLPSSASPVLSTGTPRFQAPTESPSGSALERPTTASLESGILSTPGLEPLPYSHPRDMDSAERGAPS